MYHVSSLAFLCFDEVADMKWNHYWITREHLSLSGINCRQCIFTSSLVLIIGRWNLRCFMSFRFDRFLSQLCRSTRQSALWKILCQAVTRCHCLLVSLSGEDARSGSTNLTVIAGGSMIGSILEMSVSGAQCFHQLNSCGCCFYWTGVVREREWWAVLCQSCGDLEGLI